MFYLKSYPDQNLPVIGNKTTCGAEDSLFHTRLVVGCDGESTPSLEGRSSLFGCVIYFA